MFNMSIILNFYLNKFDFSQLRLHSVVTKFVVLAKVRVIYEKEA